MARGQGRYDHEQWARQQVRKDQQRSRSEEAAARAEERERKQRRDAEGKADAERLTAALDQRIAELGSILVRGLDRSARFDWSACRRTDDPPPLDLGDRGVPARQPTWLDFRPDEPGVIGGLFGGRSRREQREAAAQERYREALREYEENETHRRVWVQEQETAHQARVVAHQEEVGKHNHGWEVLQAGVERRDRGSVDAFLKLILDAVPLPEGFPRRAEVAYSPRGEQAVVRVELPPLDVVPAVAGFWYVMKDEERREKRRPDAQRAQLYRSVVCQVALLHLRDLLEADPALESVEFGGHVHATNPATGQREYVCLVSVAVDRERFAELNLRDVDPEVCLGHLNALVSRHPHAVEPVTPVRDFDRARYSFVDPVDVVAGLDSRTDLTKMDATAFEQFVRQVFEAMGMQGWNTERSGDDGVDAVVFNKDPIVGGLTIVQAKRYTRVVGVSHVRELVGAMDEKRAGRGIIVTTSWFASGCWTKARDNGRVELIEGSNLRQLVKEHLGLDVLVAQPSRRRKP